MTIGNSIIMYFLIFSNVFIIIHNKNILYNLFILSLVYIGYFELIGLSLQSCTII